MNNRDDRRLGYSNYHELAQTHLKLAQNFSTLVSQVTYHCRNGLSIQDLSNAMHVFALYMTLKALYSNHQNNYGARSYTQQELQASNHQLFLFRNKEALHKSLQHTAINITLVTLCAACVAINELNRYFNRSNNPTIETIAAGTLLFVLVESLHFALNKNFGAEVQEPVALRL